MPRWMDSIQNTCVRSNEISQEQSALMIQIQKLWIFDVEHPCADFDIKIIEALLSETLFKFNRVSSSFILSSSSSMYFTVFNNAIFIVFNWSATTQHLIVLRWGLERDIIEIFYSRSISSSKELSRILSMLYTRSGKFFRSLTKLNFHLNQNQTLIS